MTASVHQRRGALFCSLLLAVALSVSLTGCGGANAERVQVGPAGAPPTGADGKPQYQEDSASKAAGGSGMPLTTTPVK